MDTEDLRNKLLMVARAYANEHSWPWIEPVEVQLARSGPGNRVWSVRTNILACGRNIRILIRDSDLAIVEAAFLPR